MDIDRINAGESFKDVFLEGDDVPTVVGVAAIVNRDGSGKMVSYANATVDYAGVKESLRESYAKTFESGWDEKYFERGFDITRKALDIVTVSSKRQALSVEFGRGDVDVLKAPSFFVDLHGDEYSIGKFYEFAEKTKLWVLHIRTTTNSYFWTVSYPDGTILSAHRREPMTLIHKDGGAA